MIKITSDIVLDESELTLSFVRASGPGGQNVNKVSSAVELRFDVAHSPSLPEALKERLKKLAGRRLTDDGVLLIDAHRFRTQGLNRKDAIARLVALLQAAAIEPKTRKATRPSRGAREERLQTKRKTSLIKQARRTNISHTD
ncbi:MAG: alternative ribosome rescue aminoacyl-tRNA hydrolase ArfB [Pseudomonadota bacterium]